MSQDWFLIHVPAGWQFFIAILWITWRLTKAERKVRWLEELQRGTIPWMRGQEEINREVVGMAKATEELAGAGHALGQETAIQGRNVQFLLDAVYGLNTQVAIPLDDLRRYHFPEEQNERAADDDVPNLSEL